MSNPFRRKINADTDFPQSSSTISNIAAPGTTLPLSINTTTKIEKHVRIASPPDTKISPASYPSSPEFARLTPSPQHTIVPYSTDATFFGPSDDPLLRVDSNEDNDGLILEALRNTRQNIASTSVPPPTQPSNFVKREDAVQNTLSKFASRPNAATSTTADNVATSTRQSAKRQTMDVDAFARLLLTGGSVPAQTAAEIAAIPTSVLPNALSESSSTADSASISHQSIFEAVPRPIGPESPRTSHELDEVESVATRRSLPSREVSDSLKKPPPPPAPKPRRGKSVKQVINSQHGDVKTPSPIESSSPVSDFNKSLPPAPSSDSSRRGSIASIIGSDPSMQIKRPPTPPLSRRKSHGPNKTASSRVSPSLPPIKSISSPTPSSPTTPQATKPPPPPPSRRISQRIAEGTSSVSLAEQREPDSPDLSKPMFPKLVRTTSQATRSSTISSENTPPPLPPPRRHRGSSNASQRPSPGLILVGSNSNNISEDPAMAVMEGGKKTAEGSSRDILRDLAALQAEVDALRKQGFGKD